MRYLYLPFILQSIIMGIDEGIHLKRGLGLWERVGHPLDTLTVLVPLSFVVLNDYSSSHLKSFILLSAFSCLFITKDEFIHRKECSIFENWLHSLLFVLHPLIFLSTGLLWVEDSQNVLLIIQPIIIFLFMIYQIFKWSPPWKQMIK